MPAANASLLDYARGQRVGWFHAPELWFIKSTGALVASGSDILAKLEGSTTTVQRAGGRVEKNVADLEGRSRSEEESRCRDHDNGGSWQGSKSEKMSAPSGRRISSKDLTRTGGDIDCCGRLKCSRLCTHGNGEKGQGRAGKKIRILKLCTMRRTKILNSLYIFSNLNLRFEMVQSKMMARVWPWKWSGVERCRRMRGLGNNGEPRSSCGADNMTWKHRRADDIHCSRMGA